MKNPWLAAAVYLAFLLFVAALAYYAADFTP